MLFDEFFSKCKNEPTVSDFESYLAHCIFEKGKAAGGGQPECTLEEYCRARDLAFDRRDEEAAKWLYDLCGAMHWQAAEWEGALR